MKLSDDLLASTLLWLTWKETEALRRTCRTWQSITEHAKKEYGVCKAAVVRGTDVHDVVRQVEERELPCFDTRFAPALIWACWKHPRSFERDPWPLFQNALERHELVPEGCTVLGIPASCSMRMDGYEEDADDSTGQVVLVISAFCLPNTAVDVRGFQVKDLRIDLANGMDFPFPRASSRSEDCESFLLLSMSNSSAEALLTYMKDVWEISDPIVGGALSSMSQARIFAWRVQTACGRSDGRRGRSINTFGTVLVRLFGRTRFLSAASNVHVPVSPCVHISTAVTPTQTYYGGYWYQFSTLDVPENSMLMNNFQGKKMGDLLTADSLTRLMRAVQLMEYDKPQEDEDVSRIQNVGLEQASLVILLPSVLPQDCFGVMLIPDALAARRNQAKKIQSVQKEILKAGYTPLAGFILSANDAEGSTGAHWNDLEALQTCCQGAPSGALFAQSVIGPSPLSISGKNVEYPCESHLQSTASITVVLALNSDA